MGMPDINWSPVAEGLRAMAEKNYDNFMHIQYCSIKELVKILDWVEYYARRCENSQDCGNCDCPWCYNQQMDFERWLKQKYGNED